MKKSAVKLTVIIVIAVMALYSWSIYSDYEAVNYSGSFLPKQDLSLNRIHKIIDSNTENEYLGIRHDVKEEDVLALRIVKNNMSCNRLLSHYRIFSGIFSNYSTLILYFLFLLLQFCIIKFVHCSNAL